MYLRAWGCFVAAALRLFSFTSQRATMFSLVTSARLPAPRPPEPIMARLSLLFGDWAERIAGKASVEAASVPVFVRKVRREVRVFIVSGSRLRVCGLEQKGKCGKSSCR